MGMQVSEALVNQRDKEKLKEGEHVVEVIDTREYDGEHGHGFFIDFKVISGPSPAGKLGSLAVFPDQARGGPKMPVKTAVAREKGKLLVFVAAVLGYSSDKALEVINQARFDAFFGQKPCPYIGRRLCVKSVKNARKENSYFYQAYPITEGQAPVTTFAGDNGSVAPSAPSAPALPSAPSATPEQKAAADGWLVHPQSPAHMYRGKEVFTVEEVLSRY